MEKNKKIARKISVLLIIAGILIASYPLYTTLRSYYEQSKLEKELAVQALEISDTTADDVTPLSEVPVVTSPVAANTAEPTPAKASVPAPEPIKAMMQLKIPAINISAIVVSGTSPSDLDKGPGWYVESSLPGEGNTAIAGHKNMYGSWFRNLYKLQPGDEIILTYKGEKYTYVVERVFTIELNDWSVIAKTDTPVLTLTTCYDDTYRLACRAVMVQS